MALDLDHTRLGSLAEAIGASGVARLAAEVANDLSGQLAQLGGLLLVRQFDEARALAHRLRGRVSSFGCQALHHRLETIERELRPGLATAFSDESIDALKALGARTAFELLRWASSLSEDRSEV